MYTSLLLQSKTEYAYKHVTITKYQYEISFRYCSCKKHLLLNEWTLLLQSYFNLNIQSAKESEIWNLDERRNLIIFVFFYFKLKHGWLHGCKKSVISFGFTLVKLHSISVCFRFLKEGSNDAVEIGEPVKSWELFFFL